MKALTLTQPWATLVALGAKTIETRGWQTDVRGRIGIHAAKSFPVEARRLCSKEPFRTVLRDAGFTALEQLPTASLVATAMLADVFRFKHDTAETIRARSAGGKLPKHEADFGDFTARRYGFYLRDVMRLPSPIVVRGALGFWDVPEDLLSDETGLVAAVAL